MFEFELERIDMFLFLEAQLAMINTIRRTLVGIIYASILARPSSTPSKYALQ